MRLTMLLLTMPVPTIAALPPAAAHAADAPCGAIAAPPAELAGWAHRQPLAAGGHVGGGGTPAIALGQAAEVTLGPVAAVAFAAPLAKPPAPGDMAGLLAFRVPLAGTYRVAIGGGAWIDVVQAGKRLASIAHSHGPACSGIRKIVDFRLAPGGSVLELSGAAAATLPVMIVRLP